MAQIQVGEGWKSARSGNTLIASNIFGSIVAIYDPTQPKGFMRYNDPATYETPERRKAFEQALQANFSGNPKLSLVYLAGCADESSEKIRKERQFLVYILSNHFPVENITQRWNPHSDKIAIAKLNVSNGNFTVSYEDIKQFITQFPEKDDLPGVEDSIAGISEEDGLPDFEDGLADLCRR